MTTPTTGAPTSSVSLVTPRMLVGPASLGVVGGMAVAAVASVAGWSLVALVAMVASAVAEPFLHAREPVLIKALRAASLGLGTRIVLRLLMAAIVLAHGGPDAGRVVGFAVAALLWLAALAVLPSRDALRPTGSPAAAPRPARAAGSPAAP